jgi:hypothetical protein
MLWGSYNNNVFAFTSLPGSCVILPILKVSFFTRNEHPGILFLLFFLFFFGGGFVICCPFLSERRFSRVVCQIREILFFQNPSQKGRTGTVAVGRQILKHGKKIRKKKKKRYRINK